MNKTFHLVYKEDSDKFMSKGENFVAETLFDAYDDFMLKHPFAMIIAAYDLDALNEIRGTLGEKKVVEEADYRDNLDYMTLNVIDQDFTPF